MCIQSWLGWCVHCWPRICISLGHHSEYLVKAGEPQCAGYLGQKGGGWPVKEEGEEKRKGRGGREEGEAKNQMVAWKLRKWEEYFIVRFFMHTPPSFSFLPSSLSLNPPQYLTKLLPVIIDSPLCVYWKCLSSLSLPVNDGKWGACCWATNSKRCCPLCDFYIIALELVDWGWHCVL